MRGLLGRERLRPCVLVSWADREETGRLRGTGWTGSRPSKQSLYAILLRPLASGPQVPSLTIKQEAARVAGSRFRWSESLAASAQQPPRPRHKTPFAAPPMTRLTRGSGERRELRNGLYLSERQYHMEPPDLDSCSLRPPRPRNSRSCLFPGESLVQGVLPRSDL